MRIEYWLYRIVSDKWDFYKTYVSRELAMDEIRSQIGNGVTRKFKIDEVYFSDRINDGL